MISDSIIKFETHLKRHDMYILQREFDGEFLEKKYIQTQNPGISNKVCI